MRLWMRPTNTALCAPSAFTAWRCCRFWKRAAGKKESAFLNVLIDDARDQAAAYPDFLEPHLDMTAPLSNTELQVLRLICADKSNAEIGAILGIRLATVKTHVSHILQKLGVKRRSEAKTMAEKLHLL